MTPQTSAKRIALFNMLLLPVIVIAVRPACGYRREIGCGSSCGTATFFSRTYSGSPFSNGGKASPAISGAR